jgi:hypothetical protein
MGNVIGGGDFDLNTQTNITAIPNVGYRFVQWNDGNTESTRTITVTQDLTYTAIFEINTGIENINATAVSVYPNPATDYLTITLSGNVYQATFTLYDMQGRMLIKEEVKNEDMISVNNLASGIYVYSVNVGKESHKGKIARK